MIPTEHTDPINSQILAVSEDLIAGFQAHPFELIAEKSGVPFDVVIERIKAMLEAGVIRRAKHCFPRNSLTALWWRGVCLRNT